MATIMLMGQPKGYKQLIYKILLQGHKIINVTQKNYKWEICDEKYQEVYLDILHDFDKSLSEIMNMHKNEPIDAIISVHEFYQAACCVIAQELGIKAADVQCVVNVTNKLYMKKMFTENNVNTAKYMLINKDDELEEEIIRINRNLTYPLVVKMCTGMGSIGVIRVNDEKELRKAIKKNQLLSVRMMSSSLTEESQKSILVEEYISGDEYTVDGFVIDGKWNPMIMCEKYPRMEGPVFQETMYMFSPLDGKMISEELFIETQKAVLASGVGDGPFHIEVRRGDVDNKYYIIEMAPRISGMGSTFYNLLLHSTDYDIYDLWIDMAIGNRVEIPTLEYKYNTFEYDAYAMQPGTIKEFRNLEDVLKKDNLMYYEKFKDRGDYTGEPGMNPETTIVFYFRTNSREESMRQIDWLYSQFNIVT